MQLRMATAQSLVMLYSQWVEALHRAIELDPESPSGLHDARLMLTQQRKIIPGVLKQKFSSLIAESPRLASLAELQVPPRRPGEL